ncbi:MAG: hypothetical protein M1814_004789 [Vezdaea aestivalis]|nr:MAG: hypothetical protein M1814_004789 [Vezdaea aestivalis]
MAQKPTLSQLLAMGASPMAHTGLYVPVLVIPNTTACIAYNEAHVDSPATLVWGLSLAETSGLFDDRIFASCRANCRCPSPRDSLLSFKLAKARKMYEARQRERVEPDLNVLEPDMSDYDGLLFPGEQRGKETVRGQCGVACNGEYKCAGQRDRPNLVRGKCVCKAVPVAKKSWAVLGCAAQASKGFARLGGRRRAIEVEEEHFCPCNATYVSAGCCGSDGLVWERPEERMGSLWTIDQAEDDSLP